MDYLRNYVFGHFQPIIRIPDIIYLLKALLVTQIGIQMPDKLSVHSHCAFPLRPMGVLVCARPS